MRFIVGFLGFLSLLVGLAAAGLIAAAAASGQAVMQPLGQLWFNLDRGSLNLAQATIERGVWPPLWQSGIFPVLQQPAPYVALGALAIAIVLLLLARGGRRQDHKFH